MEYIQSFLERLPLTDVFIIVGLSAILWHGVKAFIDTYVKTRSKSLAEDVNLQAELRRLILSEEAKITIQRLNTEKALGAMKILRLLAEVETKLTDWQLTVYFRMDELNETQSIESLGRQDLKCVAALLVDINKETNAYSILLGTGIYRLVLEWVSLVHKILFSYENAYQTSIKINSELEPTDSKRVTTVSELLKNDVDVKIPEIGNKRQEILKYLSNLVHLPLLESES